VSSSGDVVQCIKHDIEGLKPRDVKLGIHNVRMVGLELCVRPELLRNFLGNLDESVHVLVFQISYR
jgi:hypothetical protein